MGATGENGNTKEKTPEDPQEFIDVTVGCLGEVDRWGITDYKKGRTSKPISASALAVEMQKFFFDHAFDISPEMIEERMKSQSASRETSTSLDIMKAIETNEGRLVNPDLGRELLCQLPFLFIAITQVNIGEAFRLLGRLFSRETNQNPKTEKDTPFSEVIGDVSGITGISCI